MADSSQCHVIGRGDLKPSARQLPLNKVKLHHIMAAALDHRQIKDAKYIVLKVSSTESVTLKDTLPED